MGYYLATVYYLRKKKNIKSHNIHLHNIVNRILKLYIKIEKSQFVKKKKKSILAVL